MNRIPLGLFFMVILAPPLGIGVHEIGEWLHFPFLASLLSCFVAGAMLGVMAGAIDAQRNQEL